MADVKKIKARIKQIAGSRKNTTIEDIEWVVTQLGQNGYKTASRPAGGNHQTLFTVAHRNFGIATHTNGSRQLKSCYVDDFLDAMDDLGLL